MANEVVSAGSGPAQGLEIQRLKSELIALRRAAASRSAPDPRINQRIAILEDEIAKKQSGVVGMAKGGSVIKKSGSKAAKAGVTKFSPVKTTKLAAGGMTKKQTAKVGKVMGEFKDKSLHSGKGGPVVKSPKQAIAIALSEARNVKKK
jgi:hypothetical protein